MASPSSPPISPRGSSVAANSSSPNASATALPSAESFVTSPRLDPIIEHVVADHSRPQTERARASSITSISFGSPAQGRRDSPGGMRKVTPRIRDASPPPPSRFQHHVSFDNFGGGEPTERNTISFTLNVKHKGYQFKRRSRTFMVGIDENFYSDIALQWMLEELVDDGDQIICLRVVEKNTKLASDRNLEKKQYQAEAKEMMKRIQEKNDEHRAISIVLEFAIGKLQPTFQKMIQIYEPAMLIVGTRGRSLGGMQSLISNHSSFSKWCLQYSPVPVVVVRPTEKRIKKKNKREADPSRQDYARILRESGLDEHETDGGSHSVELEISNTPDGEAHAVAAAIGLPAAFDPTLKPIDLPSLSLQKVESVTSDKTSVSRASNSPDSRPVTPNTEVTAAKSASADSGDESSEGESDDEGEFEAVPGELLLGNGEEDGEEKKKRLHDMEVGEAKALLAPGGRKSSVGSVESSLSSR
ncbi:Adenine nucleotide alpha hydrolases-like protein [Glarea lozoyensis ATCC 20868]|uniref:Adenine nucleotide alpha hydrolases-like protein n=1 Tax=Glarea lozoyensis (strain ATCC 20868 / MF5171) TaxID=1116229 RepID=S3CZ41_GLAL2|nr:Adenine nucleotide alpha hydrolases-like protein [Glarea lozoyensis ATCC 20868]EPE30194.1 Adenine nucleotide alpha hydrolases-like protein [Glarea lozoyensis ATCC 20868]